MPSIIRPPHASLSRFMQMYYCHIKGWRRCQIVSLGPIDQAVGRAECLCSTAQRENMRVQADNPFSSKNEQFWDSIRPLCLVWRGLNICKPSSLLFTHKKCSWITKKYKNSRKVEKMREVSALIPIVHWAGVQHAALQGGDNGISVPAAQRQPVLTTFSIHNGFSLLWRQPGPNTDKTNTFHDDLWLHSLPVQDTWLSRGHCEFQW